MPHNWIKSSLWHVRKIWFWATVDFPCLIGIVWGILSPGTPERGRLASSIRHWTAGIATQQDMGPGGAQNASHESARWSVVKEGKALYGLLAALSTLR
jgi:hypothetical protein